MSPGSNVLERTISDLVGQRSTSPRHEAYWSDYNMVGLGLAVKCLETDCFQRMYMLDAPLVDLGSSPDASGVKRGIFTQPITPNISYVIN